MKNHNKKKNELYNAFHEKDVIIKRIEMVVAAVVLLLVCSGIYMKV